MKAEIAKNIRRDFGPFTFEALNEYVIDRIDSLHLLLEKDKDDFHKHQGAIEELRKILRLKEDINNVLELVKR